LLKVLNDPAHQGLAFVDEILDSAVVSFLWKLFVDSLRNKSSEEPANAGLVFEFLLQGLEPGDLVQKKDSRGPISADDLAGIIIREDDVIPREARNFLLLGQNSG
jgi:hypothetical protein